MINYLHIINFQSHKDTTLEFDPGVNIIIGPSDSGKTAILRALRWVCWNRPSGESFRSHWGGSTEVHLTTELTVSRIRGKKNTYEINGVELEAFKSDVPTEVQECLKLEDVNLQRQLDSPFLLSSTPSEVAQYFNRVAKLDKIDTSNQKINGWIRDIGTDIKGKEKDILSKEEELKQFDYIEKLETKVEVLEQLEEDKISKGQAFTKLNQLISKIKDIEQTIIIESKILETEPIILSILNSYERKKEIEKRLDKICSLTDSIKNIRKEITTFDSLISVEDTLTNIITLIESKNSLEMRRNALEKLVSNIQYYTNNESLAKREFSTLNEEYEKIFPDVCPLCGQKVKK